MLGVVINFSPPAGFSLISGFIRRMFWIGQAHIVRLLVLIREMLASVYRKSVGGLLRQFRFLEYAYRKFVLVDGKSPRMYIPNGLSLPAFFEQLNAEKANYVVIRWAHELHKADLREDIDLLCADKDVERVKSRLVKHSWRGQPVDLYSVSGLEGTGDSGRPYFPPGLGKFLLENSSISESGVRSLSLDAELLSLTYHLVVHKRWSPDLTNPTVEHQRILARIGSLDSSELGQEKLISRVLKQLNIQGFMPPLEDIRMILREVPESPLKGVEIDSVSQKRWAPNIIFLLCRESLFKFGAAKQLEQSLVKDGLQIIERVSLDEGQRSIAKGFSRGGNWSRGPYLRSGGEPQEIWVLWDSFPELDVRFAGLAPVNRTLDRKEEWRKSVNSVLSPWRQSNMVHSTDCVDEGVQLLRQISAGASLSKIETISNSRVKNLLPSEGYALLGSQLGRSRVLLKDFPTPVVTKIFAYGFEDYLNRELDFYEEFQDLAMVPKILETVKNGFVVPKLKEIRRHSEASGLEVPALTSSQVAELLRFIVTVNSRGWILGNFTPENLMQDDEGNLMAIDFEFAQRVQAPSSWFDSPDFCGLDFHSNAIKPNGWLRGMDHWDVVWRPSTGLRLEDIKKMEIKDVADSIF